MRGWAVRFYAASTRLLPADFRARYGDSLVECFAAIEAEALRERGRWAALTVLARSVADVLVRAVRAHAARLRAGARWAARELPGWGQDVAHAARRLRRRPAFSAASIGTLALGVAAATSVFTLVNRVVLRPLPYPESGRLVQLDHGSVEFGFDRGLGMTYGFFRFYAERLSSVSSAAMFSAIPATLTGVGDPLQLQVMRATPSLGAVLGVEARAGRWFTDAEGGAGEPLTAMLSHALWTDRFGADASVVGRSIVLDDIPYEVVGVLPETLTAPFDDAAVFIPREVPATGIGGWNDVAVARMADGRTPADVEQEMRALLPALRAESDDPERVRSYLDDARVFPAVRTLEESVVGDVRATLWILLGAVGVVLLIATANVANLFLVRGEESQRESGVRAALGAGRLRLARGLLAETGLIAASACGLGLAAAAVAVRVLRERAPVNVPRLAEVRLDGTSVGVAVLVCLAAALLLGLPPALSGAQGVATRLDGASGRSTASRRRLRSRSALVATQVALALVLLVGSGLLFRTFQALRAVDLGFRERSALTFQIGLPPAAYDRQAAVRFHDALLERLRALPGVESAALVAQCLPLSGSMCWGETLAVEGREAAAGEVPQVTGVRAVSAGYLATLGVPVRGRGVEAEDARSAAPGAVLSESAGRAYFGGDDPIGRRVSFGGDEPTWFTVVGVAGDVRQKVATEEFQSVIYLPARADVTDGPPPHAVAYAVKTSGPPAALAPAVRAAVAELDPDVPVASVRTLGDLVAEATAPAAFALTLVGVAALVSLLLGAVGVYAVVAYSVSRRTAEIGVRMALGARAGDVRRMVLRQGGGAVAAGAALGLVGALALTRWMQSLLFGVTASDPATYAAVTALMLGVAALAMWLPARRAARLDPVRALKGDG